MIVFCMVYCEANKNSEIAIMNSPQAPTPPDLYQTASAQGAANIDTALAQAQLNNTNQVTPYGNITYDKSSAGSYVPTLGGGQEWILVTRRQPRSRLACRACLIRT